MSDQDPERGKGLRKFPMDHQRGCRIGVFETDRPFQRRTFQLFGQTGKFEHIRQSQLAVFFQCGIEDVEDHGFASAAVQKSFHAIPGELRHAGIVPDVGTERVGAVIALDRTEIGGHFANISLFRIGEKEDRTFLAAVRIVAGADQLPDGCRGLGGSVAVFQHILKNGGSAFSGRIFSVIAADFPAVHDCGETGCIHPHAERAVVAESDPAAGRIFGALHDPDVFRHGIAVFVQDIGVVFGQVGKNDPAGAFVIEFICGCGQSGNGQRQHHAQSANFFYHHDKNPSIRFGSQNL